jgi:hypothetical protein
MGKLTIGMWVGRYKRYYWQKGGREEFGKPLTKDQYTKFCTLSLDNKEADVFEMSSEGDERLKELMEFTMGE